MNKESLHKVQNGIFGFVSLKHPGKKTLGHWTGIPSLSKPLYNLTKNTLKTKEKMFLDFSGLWPCPLRIPPQV